MLRKMKVTAGAELVAQAVEPLAAPAAHPSLRAFQAAATAVSPSVFPTERYRSETKAMMLREFNRPKTTGRADAGSRDLDAEVLMSNVVRVGSGGATIVLADLEAISPEQAAAASDALDQIIARHDERSRQS